MSSHLNWETALVTKAINKTIARKPKNAEKRKEMKQKQRQYRISYTEQH